MNAGTALWPPAAHAFPAERLDEFLVWAAELGASDIAFQTGEPGRVEQAVAHRMCTAGNGHGRRRVRGPDRDVARGDGGAT